MKTTVSTFRDFNEVVQEMSETVRNNPGASFNIEFEKADKQRTLSQNKALHLYCRWVAEALNDAGLTVAATMKNLEIPWTEHLVKELMWKAVLKLSTGKKSTTEETTIEHSDIYDIMGMHLADRGIIVPIPDRRG